MRRMSKKEMMFDSVYLLVSHILFGLRAEVVFYFSVCIKGYACNILWVCMPV